MAQFSVLLDRPISEITWVEAGGIPNEDFLHAVLSACCLKGDHQCLN